MSSTAFFVQPQDAHNEELVRHVRPPGYINPKAEGAYDLVVIGAGTAGLVGAGAATIMGARVALIERNLLGGDCLNYGCVPSKALIRAAEAAHEIRNAERFGVRVNGSVEVDFAKSMEWVRKARAQIAPHDGVKRFTDMGMDVYIGDAAFRSEREITVAGETLRFRRALIATGARAASLPIPGLHEAGALTNESIFSLTQRPKRLAVIGAGPIGCELAQALQRLGCEVTVLQRAGQILEREDPDAAAIILKQLQAEGVRIVTNAETRRVEKKGKDKLIHYEAESAAHELRVDEILVGAGRTPNVENLGLEAASVEYDSCKGVKVSDYLRTTNPHVYAAGDICLALKFTHSADAAARVAVENALFFGFKKQSALMIPRATYTDPEIATVGLTAHEAEQRGIAVETRKRPLDEVDRAICNGATEGFLKIYVRKGTDKIVGATLVAPNAGDIISELGVAIVHGIGLKKLSKVIHPYPTQAEIIKQAADDLLLRSLVPLKPVARWLLAVWRIWN